MKTSLLIVMLMLSAKSFSQADTKGGGGGDASEARVNEIRSDILNWLDKGGAKGLKLPSGIALSDYEREMKRILQPKEVVVGFVEKDHESDEELQVSVEGIPKTCRGFYSRLNSRPHILCNISRFQTITESDQYRLIHHEYAGLVSMERNDGASSDYEISSQLTDYLVPVTILRLAVKKPTSSFPDGSLLNGLYGDYTPNSPGLHVEGFSNEVIVTAVNNPFYNEGCGDVCGTTHVYNCEVSGNWCYINFEVSPGACRNTRLKPLQDGNFLIYNPCRNETYKLIKTSR